MFFEYLERGVAAGSIAGVAYGVFVAAVGNPLTEYIEEMAHQGHEHGPAVTETTTAVVGVGSGVLWGIFLGGIFGLAYFFLEPSLPGRKTTRAYVLAGAGFLTVSAMPWLVLPPAVPGVEQTLGTEPRLVIYGSLMAVGALVAATSIFGYRRTLSYGRHPAIAAAAVPIVVAALAVSIGAPTITTGGELPGDLVFAYQGMVVVSQAALWALIAGSYGWLYSRGGDGEPNAFETTVPKDG